MSYKLIRPFLMKLDPEVAHHLTLNLLNAFSFALIPPIQNNPIELFGLNFPNPVGLAAGLDKNGDYIDALGGLGFGFLEIGTVTPKPQVGNPKPRLFRIPQRQAIINRMGFNNKGVDYLVAKVKQRKYRGVLGINIGKNATTPLENATDDYVHCLEKVYPYADYITVNISSPNTQGLRDLQGAKYLELLVTTLKSRQKQLATLHHKQVPLLVKIAPDLSDPELEEMAQIFLAHNIDGIIATNTTLARDGVKGCQSWNEAGGLSGGPLFDRATSVLTKLKTLVADRLPIIASGGILTTEHAKIKFAEGAKLIQLYTGLIYEGPKLVRSCINDA
jgi:dihydroorotate dehydrogenase